MRSLWAAILCLLLGISSSGVVAQSGIENAEASFNYIASTLQTFRTTGRLVNNPGIDGADLEAYIELLDFYYDQFSASFNRDSAMCKFYQDPENARMTIEQRAELSFSFLRDLDDRVSRFILVDEEFQEMLEREFGSMLLRNVGERKLTSVSSQRLPSSNFDGAAVISFIDSMCV